MSEDVVQRAVGAFMQRDLDGILAVADPRIELRSLLTEAERPLYRGHDGVRDWFEAVFGVSPTGGRSRGPRRTTRTVPS